MDNLLNEIVEPTVAVELNEKEKEVIRKIVQEMLNEDANIFKPDDSIN